MTNYHSRFSDVVDFIEQHLDDELDVERLCLVANLSKYHFHRQCSLYFGMSVMSLVRLLRLKRAAYQLAYRNELSVLSVALNCGYKSHEAFSRFFKKCFKQTPIKFRNNPDWAPWQQEYQPVLSLRSKIMALSNVFNVELIDVTETNVAVMEHRSSPATLPSTIQQFIQWRRANKLPPSKSRTFNLIYDDPRSTAAEDYRFDLCCSVHQPVDSANGSVINKVIPAGKCARVRHVGSDDVIGDVVDYLYSEWLESSEFSLRDFPLYFERVSFFPEVPESDMVTDVYLPIK